MRPISKLGALAASVALAASGCGGSSSTSEPERTAGPTTASAPSNTERPAPGATESTATGSDGRAPEPGQSSGKPTQAQKDDAAAGAERVYSAYIDAINAHDGGTLCRLMPADAFQALKPPVVRGDCAGSLAASIGYADPRGYPVWKHTDLTGIDSSSIGSDITTARLTASIVTEFADRSEPSIESDIVYLEVGGRAGRWRLAKPSSAIYRAIGRPEPPADVISPP